MKKSRCVAKSVSCFLSTVLFVSLCSCSKNKSTTDDSSVVETVTSESPVSFESTDVISSETVMPYSIVISNRNDLMDANDFLVHIDTDAPRLDVVINDEITDSIEPDGHIDYRLPTDGSIKTGWNYIEFQAENEIGEVSSCGIGIHVIENGPDVCFHEDYLLSARTYNNLLHVDYSYYEEFMKTTSYVWNGKSLSGVIYDDPDAIQFDDQGIPKVKYEDGYYYNPVTIGQRALGYFNRYLETGDASDRNEFLYLSDYLIEMQEEDGSYRYEMAFALKPTMTIPPGFVSGMAQGEILSVFIRAYDVSKDTKYLDAGYKTLEFLLKDADEDPSAGCRRSLSDFVEGYPELEPFSDLRMPEEFVTSPTSYILNGNMIAMVGLYDWYEGAPEEYGAEDAKEAFDEAISAMKVVLPYYDYYGYTGYDLLQFYTDCYVNLGSLYAHRLYIEHLHVFYMITGDEELRYWRDVFLSYEKDDFWRQFDIIYYSDWEMEKENPDG